MGGERYLIAPGAYQGPYNLLFPSMETFDVIITDPP